MNRIVYAGVLVALLAVLGTVSYLLISQKDIGISGSEAEGLEAIRPRDMRISDVRSDSFLVEWDVESDVSGYVKYGDTSNSLTLIAQGADGAVSGEEHSVRVTNLSSGKKYYFWVMSDNVAFGRNGRALEVLTLTEME